MGTFLYKLLILSLYWSAIKNEKMERSLWWRKAEKRGGGGVIAQGYKELPTNRVEHNIDEIKIGQLDNTEMSHNKI